MNGNNCKKSFDKTKSVNLQFDMLCLFKFSHTCAHFPYIWTCFSNILDLKNTITTPIFGSDFLFHSVLKFTPYKNIKIKNWYVLKLVP